MRNIIKYLFILIFSVFIFVSCSNGGGFESDEVFITLNIYNNIDDHIDQITYTKKSGGSEYDGNNLERFGYDVNKEGYIFFGGFSKPNGEGKQYLGVNNVLKVDINNYSQYWNYDIYLHYEKEDTDNIIEVSYVLPEGCYIDGELPTTLVRGKYYAFPNLYLDEHYFSSWRFKAVYDDFTSKDFGFYTSSENKIMCYNSYPKIEIFPSLSSYKNRFYIDSPQDLLNIKNHPSGEIIFVNDIDMSGVNYTPFEFSGSIDGNGHTISNLSITTTNTNAGLFTVNKGKIQDLKIKDITINSLNEKTSYIGALAGTSSGSIIDVAVGGTINSEMGVVGGIVGKMTGKDFAGCSSDLIINSGNDGASYVGGLVGRMENCNISFCINSSTINAPSTTVGGVVGSISNSNMEYCYNYGSVTATGSEVGGLIGKADGVKMLRCQNEGVVTGCNSVGGLVGVLDNSNVEILTNLGEVNGYDNVGGIIGKTLSSTYAQRQMKEVVNEGKVISVGSNVGGIIGYLDYDGSTFVLDNLTNKVSVEASGNNVGGIIGRVKGFIGFNDEDVRVNKITNCTNEGSILGSSNVGGFIGDINLNASNPYGRHPGIKIEMDTINNIGDISGENNVGGLIGNGTSQEGKGSFIKNSTSSSKVEAKHTIGGIGGYLNYISVDTCSNADSIIKATSSLVNENGSYARVGGYCGVGYEIKNCTNELDISYLGNGSYVGGIVGECTGNLSSCINKGDVNASEASLVGGVAGFINVSKEYHASSLTNEGTIKGNESVGGLVGNFVQQMTGIKDNEVHVSSFDNLINYGDVYVSKMFAGVIASVYGDAANEYLRYPTVKVTITNIENYGDIYVSNEEEMASIGGLVGYIKTDSEDSYIKYYKVSTKINGVLVNETNTIGNNVNASFIEGEYIPK
ncbi:MAG: hypothetical protein E7177_06160 [Erysipelotrichaceae bacterium]|nr:hypothetical protein [Erysipelotrichaceae bacterium]